MYQTLLYYKYLRIEDASELAEQHLRFCKDLGLKGRILIAEEGINGTVSGTREQCRAYMDYVESDPRFSGIHWKIDEVAEPSFTKMHLRLKREIVHLGLPDLDPTQFPDNHLEPAEFLAMKDAEDVVVLDVRSNYEHQLGKFKNAVTLDMENFREFPDKLEELEQYKGKKILTYCTGGIKCEKASAFLRQHGFEEVYQLKGGIINYGKQVGGEDFEGQCYVFDGRVQVQVNTVNPTLITSCKGCGEKTARMVNCANPHCNDHFVQCPGCGIAFDGACCVQCQKAPMKRAYNEKGYYAKELH